MSETKLHPVICSAGDYVLATKWSDGDTQDHWAIGFYSNKTDDQGRHYVTNMAGDQMRGNGFRRVKKISPERGRWMLENKRIIEMSDLSVWHFARCKMWKPWEQNTQAEERGVRKEGL